MEKKKIIIRLENGEEISLPFYKVHTLVVGSGAAGVNAALQLNAKKIEDILIITEGLNKGTSINTGSDKQTYYKIGMYGADGDSPESLAESLFNGGSMHGDLALVEASLSARAFLNLVNLGVSFPQDRYGQFVGYKTDHDPLQRATSVGPYTSREMCRSLINEIKRRDISIHENRTAVSLLTVREGKEKRAAGIIVINNKQLKKDIAGAFEIYSAENIVFSVGGPGGLYKTSVYPKEHTGAIGIALMAGAKAQNLPESQYGLASINFRWNVSGTYMQAIPRFISAASDGKKSETEFLRPYFGSSGEMNSAIFLKGYQWPFDIKKIAGGSSIIDILVYIETVIKGRRVFIDFRCNGDNFDFNSLSGEAYNYLYKSEALLGTPVQRLRKMNPQAIALYREHGINIESTPLEIAVCAQHNNGGLAANIWWESINIKHFFPVGEVNGSHGVYRPGGSALNSGQVGGFRASEYIAGRYRDNTLNINDCKAAAENEINNLLLWFNKRKPSSKTWRKIRNELQIRMSEAGSHIRSAKTLKKALREAWRQWNELKQNGCACSRASDIVESFRNLQLCFAHAIYLEAILANIKSGAGSRGSAFVMDKNGIPAHEKLGTEWNFAPENPDFQNYILETWAASDGTVENKWVKRCEIPRSEAWFETAWRDFRNGKHMDSFKPRIKNHD